MTFTLDITLDQNAVSTINNAGQTITLAQKVTGTAESAADVVSAHSLATAPPAIAWIAFAPFQTNTVSWSGELQLYATTNLDPVMGAVITPNSQTTEGSGIVLGSVYTYESNSFTAGSGSGQYYVAANQNGATFGFGLLAAATVNGISMSGPLNYLQVLDNEDAYFSPPSTVYVFLSSANANGTVLPAIPSSALALSLTGGSLDAEVCFNDSTNEFFLCS